MEREIKSIKHLFFQQGVLNEADFKNLRDAYIFSFIGKPKEEMVKNYFACLQSLIYLATHMKMPYDIEEINLNILFNELYNEMLRHGKEIWIDGKEGINIFFALARSQVHSTELFYEAVRIFTEELGQMMLHKDKHGFTPLNTACKEGKIALVEAMLSEAYVSLSDEDFQTLLTQPNNDGYTPFMSAYHTPALLRVLSEKIQALDLRQETIRGNTVLMLACLYGKPVSVNFLLEKAEQESEETLLYLLHHQNNNNENVLDIALRKKVYPSLDALLNYAAKHMDHEELTAYCMPIIRCHDAKAITSMLYQAKENCRDFRRFIYEEIPVLSANLMEHWSDIPEIVQRMLKYLPENHPAPDATDTENEAYMCAVI